MISDRPLSSELLRSYGSQRGCAPLAAVGWTIAIVSMRYDVTSGVRFLLSRPVQLTLNRGGLVAAQSHLVEVERGGDGAIHITCPSSSRLAIQGLVALRALLGG